MKLFSENEVIIMIAFFVTTMSLCELSHATGTQFKAKQLALTSLVVALALRFVSVSPILLGVLLLIGGIAEVKRSKTLLAKPLLILTIGGWAVMLVRTLSQAPGFVFGVKTSAILNTAVCMPALILQIIAIVTIVFGKSVKLRRPSQEPKQQGTRKNEAHHPRYDVITEEVDEASEDSSEPSRGEIAIWIASGLVAVVMVIIFCIKIFAIYMP